MKGNDPVAAYFDKLPETHKRQFEERIGCKLHFQQHLILACELGGTSSGRLLVRLFRHQLGRYEQIEIGNDILSGDNEVHEHVLLNGRVESLPTPMEHYAFPDIATFIEKHDRYFSWEAAAWRKLHSGDEKSLRPTPFGTGLEHKRWVKKATMRAPFRPA